MSQPLVKTPDICTILSVSKNGYADATATASHEIKCAFFEQFNEQESANQELTQSDAYAYLDVKNDYLIGLGYRLQGLYFMTAPLGIEQWYIITTVEVAQRKLLTNEVNNVLVTLEVAAKPNGA